MERPGVMKLRCPMRIFKIELSGSLGKPRDFGQSETGVLPIDFQAGAPRIGFDPIVTKHFSKLGHTFPVSGYSFRGCLVTITIGFHINSIVFTASVLGTNVDSIVLPLRERHEEHLKAFSEGKM